MPPSTDSAREHNFHSPVRLHGPPIVLVVAVYYLPGFRGGGPIRSIANMAEALGDEFRLRIVAYDRDLGDLAPFPNAGPGWRRVGNAEVQYLPLGGGAIPALIACLRNEPHQVLYLQSFFEPRLGLLPLILRRLRLIPPSRLIIAPRGQFSPGALRIRARRKRAFLRCARLLLDGTETWQATSVEEVAHIRAHFPKSDVQLARNIPPQLPRQIARAAKVPGTLRVVFLSRIAPKKNLLGALNALAQVHGEVTFDIYGPIEDVGYWQECERVMATLDHSAVRVAYRGEVQPDRITQTFAAYDLFFFPTFGENFGHVIVESLLAGCPCLLSDQTPWRNLAASGAGWDLPLADMTMFTRTLQDCVDASGEEMSRLTLGARALAARYLRDDESVAATRSLLAGTGKEADSPA